MPDQSQQQDDSRIERYVAMVSPKAADPTYGVLKAHLLFEELLYDFVGRRVRHRSALDSARLNFPQLIALASSLSRRLEPSSWHWVALRRLNSLRNKLAHHVTPPDLRTQVQELAEYIFDSNGTPLPSPDNQVGHPDEAKLQGSGAGRAYRPDELLNMALAGLYGTMEVVFGQREVLFAEQDAKASPHRPSTP